MTIREHLEAIRDRNACVYEPEEHDCAEGIDSGCDWCVNRRDAVAALEILDNALQFADVSAGSIHTSEVFRQVYDPSDAA